MNFLAHIALSGNDKEIAIGNLIADTILPKERKLLSEKMMMGVQMHHAIDSFTDKHPSFLNTTLLGRELLKKYAPVATDVFFDHFLAVHFKNYHQQELQNFSIEFYNTLKQHEKTLPERAQILTHYLVKHDWLNMYKSTKGLNDILTQMSKRTKYESNLNNAIQVLEQHYVEIEDNFKTLYPELIVLCNQFKF